MTEEHRYQRKNCDHLENKLTGAVEYAGCIYEEG